MSGWMGRKESREDVAKAGVKGALQRPRKPMGESSDAEVQGGTRNHQSAPRDWSQRL